MFYWDEKFMFEFSGCCFVVCVVEILCVEDIVIVFFVGDLIVMD